LKIQLFYKKTTKKQLCRRNFFNSSLFVFEKTQFENSTKTVVPFFPLYFLIREREKKREGKKGTTVFVEFSN
jgi:hypothetical protein